MTLAKLSIYWVGLESAQAINPLQALATFHDELLPSWTLTCGAGAGTILQGLF